MKKLVLIALGLFVVSCSKSSSIPVVSTTEVKFSMDVQPIFNANCTSSNCHGGSSPQQGQNLTSGHAFGSIVNVASAEVPSYSRVKPFSSDSSYLYIKITGDSRIAAGTARMPLGGSLNSSDIQTIKDWIDQGAMNN